ncbi:MAG: class I SAM-dependent methyltransferase [Bryobacteraceae bacterium]|nr:class I SAM-dependent methyltransferase [Bryobacteraceae bacterium]
MPILCLLAALMFQQHMEHKFDPLESAKSFDDPARDAWQKPSEVIAALNLKPGQSVADIGAGTGYFTVRLAKSPAAPRVYASDLEPGMVDYLRKRAAHEKLANITAVQASASSPNLPEPVDVILIVNTWHHIADRETYFKTLAKSLKPGGRLAIIDYVKGAPMGPPEHFRFAPAQIRADLKKSGYKPAAELTFLPNQQFQIFTLAK